MATVGAWYGKPCAKTHSLPLDPRLVPYMQEITCGGEWAFDLYALECIEETDSEYLGCWSDMKDMRLLSNMISDQDMTTSMCRTHCEGYTVYATQVLRP